MAGGTQGIDISVFCGIAGRGVPADRFSSSASVLAHRQLYGHSTEDYIVEMKDVDVRYVVGDEERISQILVNLLSDASKFTEKGEIRMTFRQMMRKKDSVDSCSGSMIPEREWIRSSSSGSSTPSSRRTP